MSTKRKSNPGAKSRSASKGLSGRVTPSRSSSGASAGSASSTRSDGSAKSAKSARSAKSERSSRPAEPDLNVAAVDRLVARVNEALPRGRVRSAFSGTSGLSPNAVTVVGALPGVVVVAVAVASKRPVLLLVALLVMAAAIVAVMRFGNTTRVVAELPDELVVFTSRRGTLEPYHRGPVAVEIRPYFDSRWLKVVVAGDQLFVSKRAFGAVVRELAGEDADPEEPADDPETDGAGGES